MDKSSLREAVKQRIARLSTKDRAAESRSVCRRILELLPDDLAAICGYVPLQDEIDVSPLISELLEQGVELYLPRFENNALVFRRAEDLATLTPGAFDIPEPSLDAPLLESSLSPHVLVPGRAFDRTGNRIGRGNGGYDHWIEEQRQANPTTVYWGLCFECQLVGEVPIEPHDQPVDAIITARGVELGST